MISATKLAQHAIKRQFCAFLSTTQGELFRARVLTGPSRANFFAHRAQRRGEIETNDTSATADAGQHETAIAFARPSTTTVETDNTSATEKHAKNTHFAPAKAMAVSTPPTYERA